MKKNLLSLLACLFLLASFSCSAPKNTERWTVASEKRDCVGVGIMKCFLVKTGGHNDWLFFYDNIDGFDYEPGYEYVIEVIKKPVEHPAADQSEYRYVFYKEISKVKKTSEDMPSIPLIE